MELKEMIKVMQHYENGGDVEYSGDNFDTIFGKANNKKNPNGLSWNWCNYTYRIKEQKQKVTIEKWLCQDRFGDFVIVEASNIAKHKKVKLIESYEYEVEL